MPLYNYVVQANTYQQAVNVQLRPGAMQWQPISWQQEYKWYPDKRELSGILKAMANDEIVSKEEFEEILKLEKT